MWITKLFPKELSSPVYVDLAVVNANSGSSSNTVEPDLIATEMLAFPSKSARNTNDSDLTIAIL